MIDNEIFSLIILSLILWLLSDDIKIGLREAGIDFIKNKPQAAVVRIARNDGHR